MDTIRAAAQAAQDESFDLRLIIDNGGDIGDLERVLHNIHQAARDVIKHRDGSQCYQASSTVEKLNFG